MLSLLLVCAGCIILQPSDRAPAFSASDAMAALRVAQVDGLDEAETELLEHEGVTLVQVSVPHGEGRTVYSFDGITGSFRGFAELGSSALPRLASAGPAEAEASVKARLSPLSALVGETQPWALQEMDDDEVILRTVAQRQSAGAGAPQCVATVDRRTGQVVRLTVDWADHPGGPELLSAEEAYHNVLEHLGAPGPDHAPQARAPELERRGDRSYWSVSVHDEGSMHAYPATYAVDAETGEVRALAVPMSPRGYAGSSSAVHPGDKRRAAALAGVTGVVLLAGVIYTIWRRRWS